MRHEVSDHSGFLGWFVVFALLLHGLLWVLPFPELESISPTVSKNEPVEIVTPESLESDKPVVKTSKSDETQENNDSKAEFSAEFKNRVKKETRSPNAGRFQPSGPAISGGADGPEGEGPPKTPMADLLPFSRTPNQLPSDIAEGFDTLLNTDKVMYASFINRVADQIYDAWDRHAREAIMDPRVRKEPDNITYVTKLQILLDKDGEVTSIQVLRGSGIDSLDDAPKKAFWENTPFRNPPEQMFTPEGFVRLVYEFHFEVRTSSFNILPFTI